METSEVEVPQEKVILDACCGGRMFWFNRNHPNAIYVDNRIAKEGHIPYQQKRNHEVVPDINMDFRDLCFPDNSFKLVVFDPPHIVGNDNHGWMQGTYGRLDPKTWEADLAAGFNECWRVLDDFGTLVFKWSEVCVPVSRILAVIKREPLFGHKSGKSQKTHWLCFMKIPGVVNEFK